MEKVAPMINDIRRELNKLFPLFIWKMHARFLKVVLEYKRSLPGFKWKLVKVGTSYEAIKGLYTCQYY